MAISLEGNCSAGGHSSSSYALLGCLSGTLVGGGGRGWVVGADLSGAERGS